jgi:hypothetical protein
VLVCTSVHTAQIGVTSMGMYSGLSAIKLDSHTNMAIAGSETTIIACSGTFANGMVQAWVGHFVIPITLP